MRHIPLKSMFLAGVLIVLWFASGPLPGYTGLTLVNPETGNGLASFVLADDENVVLTWRNSLWGLNVTEAFVAKNGVLIQTEVTFAQPDGSPPPRVSPRDVEDLYQTGGAFSAKGLARPLQKVVYRISEIGEPKLRVRDRIIEFKPLVGFGGRVVLTASKPNLLDIVRSKCSEFL